MALFASGSIFSHPSVGGGGDGSVLTRIAGGDISSNGASILAVIDTSAPRTATILSVDIAVEGKIFIINDESSGAGTNMITIVGESGEMIDGVPSVEITVDDGAVRLYSASGNLFSY